jgi:phage terminase large subunit
MKIYEKFLPLFELDGGKYDTFVLTGGRGSCKTGHACRAVLTNLMGKKKKKVVCFRETKVSQQNSLITEFQTLINDEFKNRGFDYNTEKIWNKINGSEITFVGLKDTNANAREAVKGLSQVDIFLIDEAQAITAPVWDVLLKTIRKDGAVLIAIYNRIEDDLPIEQSLFINYDNKSVPDKTYFIEVNYPELVNTGFISQRFIEYAEMVKKNKPEEYERDYLNKPRGLNVAKVVKYWDKENINENIRYCEDLDIYWSLDFNVNPAMSTLSHYDGNKFFVFDEIVMDNCITQDVVDEFMYRYPVDKFKGVVQICGDASGSYRKTQSKYTDYMIIINTLGRNGYRYNLNIHRKNPTIQARINAFNNMVFTNDGERKVLVHPRCEKLIYNMRNLKYKEGTSIIDAPTPNQIAEDDKKKYLGHIFDAVSYMVEYFKPILRE